MRRADPLLLAGGTDVRCLLRRSPPQDPPVHHPRRPDGHPGGAALRSAHARHPALRRPDVQHPVYMSLGIADKLDQTTMTKDTVLRTISKMTTDQG